MNTEGMGAAGLPVFVSWSGGKDSCLAYHRAAGQGFRVSYLLNMIDQDGARSCSHELDSRLLQAQAQALGLPIWQGRAGQGNYEPAFKAALGQLRKQGIQGGVFGDINFSPHREWIERVCRETGIHCFFPLWECPEPQLMAELMDSGFEAIIVVAKAEFFGVEWLGRRIDAAFLRHIAALQAEPPVSPCGEAGEYHSIVVDGPRFHKRLEILESSPDQKEGFHLLRISRWGLRDRAG